jgi:hypothetical protein
MSIRAASKYVGIWADTSAARGWLFGEVNYKEVKVADRCWHTCRRVGMTKEGVNIEAALKKGGSRGHYPAVDRTACQLLQR